MTTNPNAIIAALLDIASAANSLAHCVGKTVSDDHRTVLARDLNLLNVKLAALNDLPQHDPNKRLTGPARARHIMQSFIGGEPFIVNFSPEKLAEIKTAFQQTNTPPLRAEEFQAHKIYNDADLLEQLRQVCGYVENGSSECVTICQDDATREWGVSIGDSHARTMGRARRYSARSFHQAIRLAVDGEIEQGEPK